MSSSDDIAQETTNSRKRCADTDTQASAPKRHHPTAIDQLLETMKFQQQQIKKATAIWIRLKGGEDKLGDANTNFLSIVNSAMYSGSLAIKLVGKQDTDDDDREDQVRQRLQKMIDSFDEKQQDMLPRLRDDLEGDVYDIAQEVLDETVSTEWFTETVRERIDGEREYDMEWSEIKKFVLNQMKMAKDAPDNSQDVLREHEAEIGFEGST